MIGVSNVDGVDAVYCVTYPQPVSLVHESKGWRTRLLIDLGLTKLQIARDPVASSDLAKVHVYLNLSRTCGARFTAVIFSDVKPRHVAMHVRLI